jgi:hypothetical protein
LRKYIKGRFKSFVGRAAARLAIVGVIAGSIFVGQSHEEAEAAPELAPAGVTYCYENGKGGILLGSECITPEEEYRDGYCSKMDKFLGNAAVTIVGGMLPISRAANIMSALGVNAATSNFGDFCD